MIDKFLKKYSHIYPNNTREYSLTKSETIKKKTLI